MSSDESVSVVGSLDLEVEEIESPQESEKVRGKDVVVIGAGPGGYVAAIRAAQLGKDVALVEEDEIGGECLNYGCIPSKALISAAKLVDRVEAASSRGITVEGMEIDFEELQEWKQGVVDRLTSGVSYLCEGNGVEVVMGHARFRGDNVVEVENEGGKEFLAAESFIVATGSRPNELPGFEIDGVEVVGSKEALQLEEIPDSLLVIGGGIIGLEIGTLYAQLGSEVTVVEILEQLLPGTEKEVVRVVERKLRKLGVEYHTSSKALGYEEGEGGKLKVSVETPEEELEVEVDKILLSVGRTANTEGLGLEEIGVETDEDGFIEVDKKMRTNVEGIHAIGDVTGPPLLAHKASKEGIVAAEVIAGMPSEADFVAMPEAIFTDPEIAKTGMSQTEAEEAGYDTVTGRFPLSASGRALTAAESDGFVKVVAEEETGAILGVQVVGHEASDVISEGTLAVEMGALLEDLSYTVHPHPTMSEALMEAAEAAQDKPIHILKK